MMRPMATSLCVAALMLVVVAAANSAPANASSKSKRCAAFSYHHNAAGGTYRFSRLRIVGAKCSSVRRVVTGYFKGRGEPAGPVPTDGYDVDGWNVRLRPSVVQGHRAGARFWGVYDYRPD